MWGERNGSARLRKRERVELGRREDTGSFVACCLLILISKVHAPMSACELTVQSSGGGTSQRMSSAGILAWG